MPFGPCVCAGSVPSVLTGGALGGLFIHSFTARHSNQRASPTHHDTASSSHKDAAWSFVVNSGRKPKGSFDG